MHRPLANIPYPDRSSDSRRGRPRRRDLPVFALLCLGLTACSPPPEDLGERIYQQGFGAGGRIAYEQGPGWLRMARAGCAACHGRDGQGLAMRAGDARGAAPPLTAEYLAARGYERDSLGRAITRGIAPDGREFSYYMPRWRLDERELGALLDYLARL